MARPPARRPTELELEILNVLWAAGSPATVREVQQALASAGRELAITSVTTVLNIMARKKQVRRSKGGGGAFVYLPLASHASTARNMIRDLIDRLYRGSATALVLNLLQEEDLDDEALRQLRAALNRRREKP
jgi:predicted transcriptional regulator